MLSHYIDDEYDLELLLAVSGRSEGYKSVNTAVERRNKFLNYLTITASESKYKNMDPETVRKKEDACLKYIAEQLQRDKDEGEIKELITQWLNVSKQNFISPIVTESLDYPPVEEIFPTAKDIVLSPGEIFQLKVAVIPKESVNAPLNYVSLDTSLVTVSSVGMLLAHDGRKKGLRHTISAIIGRKDEPASPQRSTDIIIQAESGVSASKEVVVDLSRTAYKVPSTFDINNFIPSYRVEQRVRLAGTDEWRTNIQNAKVGDKIEFRIQYINISDKVQNSVMIRNILPKNLTYIAGTTMLTNAAYTLAVNQDTLVTTGIDIGHYLPGANALVEFSAIIVDHTLQNGSNILVNWSQCGIGQVTLQDYATIQLNIGK